MARPKNGAKSKAEQTWEAFIEHGDIHVGEWREILGLPADASPTTFYTIRKYVDVMREALKKHPDITDDQMRAHLKKQGADAYSSAMFEHLRGQWKRPPKPVAPAEDVEAVETVVKTPETPEDVEPVEAVVKTPEEVAEMSPFGTAIRKFHRLAEIARKYGLNVVQEIAAITHDASSEEFAEMMTLYEELVKE